MKESFEAYLHDSSAPSPLTHRPEASWAWDSSSQVEAEVEVEVAVEAAVEAEAAEAVQESLTAER